MESPLRSGIAACLRAAFLFAALLPCPVHAEPPAVVTIRFDATHNEKAALADIPPGEEASYSLRPSYRRWAYLDRAPSATPTTAPDGAVIAQAATDRQGRAGLGVENRSDKPLRLRVETQLPAGLWRVDAFLDEDYHSDSGPIVPLTPRAWRMESVLQTDAVLDHGGVTVKTVDLPQHETLLLRWTETGEAALDARKAVRLALWSTADHALQDRVGGALMPVSDTLDALPILVGRGDRAKITRRIHTALLATAKAQALWENGRGVALDDRDAPFAHLVTALSEIACAAFDLVPEQIQLPADGKNPACLRVTLTNSGPRTVPLVALGIELPQGAGGAQSSDLSVFRALAPGAHVSQAFPLREAKDTGSVFEDETDVRGIVQFISDYGAATVRVTPDAPVETVEQPSP